MTPRTTERQSLARGRLGLAATVAVAGLLGAACGSTNDEGTPRPSSTTLAATTLAPPATTSTLATTAAGGSLRTKRYCEVLLVQLADGNATADVYNSFPLNDCPDALWTELDATAIAASEGAPIAVLNGPRFWLMDRIEKAGDVAELPKKDFGGIEMYRQASVAIGSMAEAATPYLPHEVDRASVFVFDAGQTVYELTDPEGTTYAMQTWSQQKDPTLAEADLADLGSRLQLPAGWAYRSRTLTEPLRIDTTTVAAAVLQDDLANSYSQITSR